MQKQQNPSVALLSGYCGVIPLPPPSVQRDPVLLAASTFVPAHAQDSPDSQTHRSPQLLPTHCVIFDVAAHGSMPKKSAATIGVQLLDICAHGGMPQNTTSHVVGNGIARLSLPRRLSKQRTTRLSRCQHPVYDDSAEDRLRCRHLESTLSWLCMH
eukprot:3689488-Amphidinium_carterae.2